ncbi:NPC intracellular cholesterol transporter 2 homolog a-like [Topomyia yanbarensis]|uniref:NPC intracellular cholesterol transporter 2 homolog a-like n=1 Tax=Topomyia yanbarensis TaxID=2498891 RepID=UPI00273A9D71|nr:NPC intracellular cholesterol transporter 2 homolog a-like [Topomyia yanbarensis]
MFKYLLLVAVLPVVMLQNADNIDFSGWNVVPVRPCGGVRPLPSIVRIENCPSMPCEMVRGTDVNMAMDFTAVQDVTTLRTQVLATALGITAPYELPADRAAACNWLVQSRCPLSPGEDLIYHLSMPITAIYPLVSVTIEIDVVDQSGQSHGCFVVDTRVVAN